MSNELKPCPFCSSKASDYTETDSGIICDTCGGRNIFNVKDWNTRPIEDGLRAENARITKVCQDTSSQLWDACRENNRLEAENAKLKARVEAAEADDAYYAALNKWEALK